MSDVLLFGMSMPTDQIDQLLRDNLPGLASLPDRRGVKGGGLPSAIDGIVWRLLTEAVGRAQLHASLSADDYKAEDIFARTMAYAALLTAVMDGSLPALQFLRLLATPHPDGHKGKQAAAEELQAVFEYISMKTPYGTDEPVFKPVYIWELLWPVAPGDKC